MGTETVHRWRKTCSMDLSLLGMIFSKPEGKACDALGEPGGCKRLNKGKYLRSQAVGGMDRPGLKIKNYMFGDDLADYISKHREKLGGAIKSFRAACVLCAIERCF